MDSSRVQPTSVYRYYDQFGVLIYVGITSRGVTRNREHNRDKAWWTYVARQEVDHLPDRAAALSHERRLIEDHRPPYNVQHNHDWRRARSDYEHARARALAAPPILERLGASRFLPIAPVRQLSRHSILMSTDLADAGVVGLLSLPTQNRRLSIAGGKASEFAFVGPFLTFRVSGGRAPEVYGGQIRVKFASQKPLALSVGAITVSIPDDGETR